MLKRLLCGVALVALFSAGCSFPFGRPKPPPPEPEPTSGSEVSPPESVAGVVSADVLNIREGPSLSAKVAGQVKRFDSLTIRERKDGWYRVEAEGVEGWAWSYYVLAKDSTGLLAYPFLSIAIRQPSAAVVYARADLDDWEKPLDQVSPERLLKVSSGDAATLILTEDKIWTPIVNGGAPLRLEMTFAWLGFEGGKTGWLPLGTSLDERRFYWQEPVYANHSDVDLAVSLALVDAPSAAESPPTDDQWKTMSERFLAEANLP